MGGWGTFTIDPLPHVATPEEIVAITEEIARKQQALTQLLKDHGALGTQPWSKRVYTVMVGLDDPGAAVSQIDALIAADHRQVEWREQELEDLRDRIVADRDALRGRLDVLRDPVRGILEYADEEDPERERQEHVRDVEEQVKQDDQRLQNLSREVPPGLEPIQAAELRDYLQHPDRWSETDGILQTPGMTVQLRVSDERFDGQAKGTDTISVTRSDSDTAGSKVTDSQSERSADGTKAGGTITGTGPSVSIEANRTNEVSAGSTNERSSGHTSGTTAGTSATVDHSANPTHPFKVFADVTVNGNTYRVPVGTVSLARPPQAGG